MVTVLKTVFAFLGERGFESHPLRGAGEETPCGSLPGNGMGMPRQAVSCTVGLSVVLA